MKNKLLMGSLIFLGQGLSSGARASDIDCFPLCVEPVKAVVKLETPAQVKLETGVIVVPREAATEADTPTKTCATNSLVQQAEELNDKVKPIRELVGYVRSPQGLAIKLVNDHIVKIPAWIGYAMDPLGSLKHKVIDEVRSRAKEAMSDGKGCETAAAIAPLDEAIDLKTSS